MRQHGKEYEDMLLGFHYDLMRPRLVTRYYGRFNVSTIIFEIVVATHHPASHDVERGSYVTRVLSIQPYRRYPRIVPLAVDVHELLAHDLAARGVVGRLVDDLRI